MFNDQFVLLVMFRYSEDLERNLYPRELSVVVGAHRLYSEERGRRRKQIAEIVEHEDYNEDDFTYDVMLLRLTSRIRYSKKVRPICVDEDVKRPPGTPCVVSGWGSTTNPEHEGLGILHNPLHKFPRSKSVQVGSGRSPLRLLCRVLTQSPIPFQRHN